MVNNFNPNSGAGFALSRFDFSAHLNGTNFRQPATTINTNAVIDGYVAQNVEAALDAISNILINVQTNGTGFVSIPDGYNCYHNQVSNPTNPYDSSIPSINGVLNDILYNTNNPLNARIADGGIIFIPAGTYKISSTILIPPGITILGEGFGTKLINQTSPLAPMFEIVADTTRIVDGGINVFEKFLFSKETRFVNLLIADNFAEPKFLGDLSYKTPQNTTSANPLISVQQGSHFTAQNVYFVGKTTYSGSSLTTCTAEAIGSNNSNPITTGTIVEMHSCFLDGFSTAVEMDSLGGTNDYFICQDNKIKFYGLLNGSTTIANNSCFLLNVCNTIITNNYIYGSQASTVSNNSVVYLNNTTSLSVPQQSKSKIDISNNTIAWNKSSSLSFQYSLISASSIVLTNSSYYTITAFNNVDSNYSTSTFTDLSTIDTYLNSTTQPITSVSASSFTLNGALICNTQNALSHISSSPYNVSSSDHFLLINTLPSSISVKLPVPTQGRIIVVKDVAGFAETNPIIIEQNSSEQIENIAGSYSISANFGVVSLISDGTNWFIVS